jgi:hypothetical protein
MPRPKKSKVTAKVASTPLLTAGGGILSTGHPFTLSTGPGQGFFQNGVDLYNNFRPPVNIPNNAPPVNNFRDFLDPNPVDNLPNNPFDDLPNMFNGPGPNNYIDLPRQPAIEPIPNINNLPSVPRSITIAEEAAAAAEEAGVAVAEETAVVAAEEAAVVAGGEGIAAILGGILGAAGAGAAAALTGGAALAAGLLVWGVTLLGKRIYDKFTATHDKHGQEAALAALARQAESNRSLKAKLEKNLSLENMQILNDHISLHTEVDLVSAKRKEPGEVQNSPSSDVPSADDSSSTIHNMHKQYRTPDVSTKQITPAPKITTPGFSVPKTTTDKQMFQPPEKEKPINVAPRQPLPQQPRQPLPQQPPSSAAGPNGELGQIYGYDRKQPLPQQPRQSFQDNSNASIHPMSTQQQPRLSASDYQYIRQRDPGYMV